MVAALTDHNCCLAVTDLVICRHSLTVIDLSFFSASAPQTHRAIFQILEKIRDVAVKCIGSTGRERWSAGKSLQSFSSRTKNLTPLLGSRDQRILTRWKSFTRSPHNRFIAIHTPYQTRPGGVGQQKGCRAYGMTDTVKFPGLNFEMVNHNQ
jgi:hypothetical protein